MRIIRFADETGQVRLGIPTADAQAQLLAGDPYTDLRITDERCAVVRLLAPVEPCNIYCIGLNYRAHVEEFGGSLPENPVVFMKPSSALNHPEAPIPLPACRHEEEVDYEAELAVVIGISARDVAVENALQHVFGYTCANDVSARRWQKHGGGGQWIRGKGFDGFCPLGPALVTADEIPDPQNLHIRCRINGQTRQDSHTSRMMFPVAELISRLSQDTTLLPGTVILTGTPAGVGFARNPPAWLLPGDNVEIEVEGIGVLRNSVVDGRKDRVQN